MFRIDLQGRGFISTDLLDVYVLSTNHIFWRTGNGIYEIQYYTLVPNKDISSDIKHRFYRCVQYVNIFQNVLVIFVKYVFLV